MLLIGSGNILVHHSLDALLHRLLVQAKADCSNTTSILRRQGDGAAGLHSCGELSPSMVRLFAGAAGGGVVRGLLNVRSL